MSELGYEEQQPTRDEIDALTGTTALIFGTNWCGYCRASHSVIEQTLAERPEVRVIRAEDGKGRPLGRSFGVKLWPTFIVLKDGVEVARAVRPRKAEELTEALDAAATPGE